MDPDTTVLMPEDGTRHDPGGPSATRHLPRLGTVTFGAVAIGWLVVLALILRHTLFISQDTVSNYGHVWYVHDRLSHAHQVPLAMPVMGHGEAFAFPYSFLPWISAALLWPIFGDWIVTLWIVLGFVLLVGATLWALPELRKGWWAAAVLVNPLLVMAPLKGQLPFMWATAFLFVAIGFWRQGRRWPAILFAGLAQGTHAAVVMPIAFMLVALRWRWEPDRRLFVRSYLWSLVPALPAAWIVFVSPVYVDSSARTIVDNFVGTVGPRSLVVALPLGLVLLRKLNRPLVPVLTFALLLTANFATGLLDTSYSWKALKRQPDTALVDFLQSPQFVPQATYRILRAGDSRLGMYQLIRARARVDSEFFPESIERHSFPDLATYAAFLRQRGVEYVIVFDNFSAVFKTNEHALLDQLVDQPADHCDPALGRASVVAAQPRFTVYGIVACAPSA